MATRTASVTGKWSQTATWGGSAVPVSGDVVIINTGVTVTYDADQSGFASGIAGITINGNGVLAYITDGTVIYLKASGNISGTGSLFIGNSALDPIPAPTGSTPEVATLAFNGAFGVSLTGTVGMHGELRAPAYAIASKTDNTHVVLAGAGSLTWLRVGDVVGISDSSVIGQHSPATETYTVSSYDASTRTITLSTNLTRSVNQNGATDYVLLVSRNILHTSLAANASPYNGVGAVLSFAGVRFKNFLGNVANVNPANGTAFTYCTVDTGTNALSGATAASVQFCTAINTANGISSGPSVIVQDCYALNASGGLAVNPGNSSFVRCVALNCVNGLLGSTTVVSAIFVDCIAYNGASGISNMRNSKAFNCTFIHNTTDAANVSNNEFYNALFNDTTDLTLNIQAQWQVTQSYDHNQVAGSFKGWCLGGNVISVASPVYDSTRPRAYQHAPIDASNPVFRQSTILVPAKGSINVRCYVQADTAMVYLPRLWVFSAGKEPLISGTADVEVTMQVGYSLNTWYVLTATFTNTANSSQPYIVRTLAKNASGNVYFDPIVRVSGLMQPALMEGLMVA